MTWQQRRDWLARFQNEYGTGDWFNNVDGILVYFSESPTFSHSTYMQLADAGVLKAIEDGMAAYRGHRALPGGTEHDAATKWKEFFRVQQGGAATFAQLSQLWGSAEQAGVQYGTALIPPSPPRKLP